MLRILPFRIDTLRITPSNDTIRITQLERADLRVNENQPYTAESELV